MKWFLALLLVSSTVLATPSKTVDAISLDYIRLSLSMTPHDGSFVDAYYGPAALQELAVETPLSLDEIKSQAKSMLANLNQLPMPKAKSMQALRVA